MITDPKESFFKNTTAIALDEAIARRRARELPRGHLGLSSIGNPDKRTVWLNFRWSLPDDVTPRTDRIFRLGDLIEDEMVDLLRTVPGVTLHSVDPETGEQFEFSYFGGHVGGHMDGAMLGVVEAPKTWHVFECKSAKDSSFKALKKAGSIKDWNPTYYAQAQNYMGASGMTRTLFAVYNKDNSEIYTERLRYETGWWENTQITAEDLLNHYAPPASSYPNREWYEIKQFKSEKYQRIYWGDAVPKPNCRNCKHARIMFDGDARWLCERWQKDLAIEDQVNGCDLHLYLPALVPADQIEDHGTIVRYKTLDGVEVWNAEDASGREGQNVFSSRELHAITASNAFNAATLADPALTALRRELSATFTVDEESK